MHRVKSVYICVSLMIFMPTCLESGARGIARGMGTHPPA